MAWHGVSRAWAFVPPGLPPPTRAATHRAPFHPPTLSHGTAIIVDGKIGKNACLAGIYFLLARGHNNHQAICPTGQKEKDALPLAISLMMKTSRESDSKIWPRNKNSLVEGLKMNQDELIAKFRPYSDDYLVEELRMLRGKITSMSQRFGLLPEDKAIEGRQKKEFLEVAENIAAIAGVIAERHPNT